MKSNANHREVSTGPKVGRVVTSFFLNGFMVEVSQGSKP